MTISILVSSIFATVNIAVLDLDGIGISAQESLILTNKLRTEVVKSGYFTVLDRSEMENVLKEQGFQQSGCTSSECAVEVGQILGVSHMLSGSIGKLADIYYIELKLIDVATSQIVKTVDETVPGVISNILVSGIPIVVARLTGQGVPQANYGSTAPVGSNSSDDWSTVQDRYSTFGDSVLLVTMDFGNHLAFSVEEETRVEVDNDIAEALESALGEALDRDVDIAVITDEMLKGMPLNSNNVVVRQRVKKYNIEMGFWGKKIVGIVEYGFFRTPSSKSPIYTIKIQDEVGVGSDQQQNVMDFFEEFEDTLEEDLESSHNELSRLDYR
jgi:hypothetical protein